MPPPGAYCDHADMAECHPGCGHFTCSCGLTWDEGSEGSGLFSLFDGPGVDWVTTSLSADAELRAFEPTIEQWQFALREQERHLAELGRKP